jgi:hypothetical protein
MGLSFDENLQPKNDLRQFRYPSPFRLATGRACIPYAAYIQAIARDTMN